MTWSPHDPDIPDNNPPRALAGYLDDLVDGAPGDSPVPVSLWRVVPAVAARTTPAGGLISSWLAHRLVATYTRRGGTVVDFDADPALRHAAAANSCGYLSVTTTGDLARLEASADVDLITFRWPRPAPVADTALADLFRACRLVLGRCGHTAVILNPPADQPHPGYGRDLVPAADAAGMAYLQHIIAVLAPAQTDTPAAPEPAGDGPSAPGGSVHIRVHVEMLIFVLGGSGAH